MLKLSTLLRHNTVTKLIPALATALALVGFAAAPAMAQQPGGVKPIVMRLAHFAPTVTQHHRNVEWFKAELEKRTNGRLVVDVFPASQLMPITQEINGVLSGQIDATYSINTIAATIDPLWGVFEMPFLFDISPDNQRHLKAFIQSERGGGVLKASIEKKGLKVISMAPTDILSATSNVKRPIRKLEDFSGLKMRIAGGKYLGQTFQRLGASPISMALTEFLPAIVQGAVDGTATGVIYTHDNRFPVKYLSNINLWYAGLPLLVSKRFFEGLPADIQKTMLEVGRDLEDYGFKVAEQEVAKRLKLMGQEMKVMVEPSIDPAELARMKAATEPVLESFIKDNPAGKGLIEEARRLAK
jgi:TRAP-type C4-dicarboxylate transport system substrate-binding protein